MPTSRINLKQIMNLGIVGSGRMGRTVISLAEQEGHRIVACCNSSLPPARSLDELVHCDVVVDFSLPYCAIEHIELYAENRIPAVIGTTGWFGQLDYVESIVARNEASILYASNFSTGMALVRRMLRSLSSSNLEAFEVSMQETHHANKLDSPSGTAIDLARVLNLNQSEITSYRLGDVKGLHQINIDSPDESIRISHEVKDRRVFAEGALLAANWLEGRTGLFTFDDVFNVPLEATSIT